MISTTTRTRYTITADEARKSINEHYGSVHAWDAGLLSWATAGPQPVIAQTFVPSSRTRRDGTRLYLAVSYGNDQTAKLRSWQAENHC